LKEKINKYLSGLIGLKLSRQTRAASMQCFQFGNLKEISNTKSIGEFALHIQCAWRFTNEIEIIAGHMDLYNQSNENAEYDENFDWTVYNSNLRDVKLNKLLSDFRLIVISACIDKFGGLEIQLDNKIKLSIFPEESSKADIEYWRLIDNKNDKSKHFVSWSTGFEAE